MNDNDLTALAHAVGVMDEAPPIRPADVVWATITGLSIIGCLIIGPLLEGGIY